MALNIYVSFDNKQCSHFQLTPEKLNWDNLTTILELSTTQVPNCDSLVLHYLHPLTNKQETVSSQAQLDTLMADLKEIPYDGLFFYAGENPKPTQSLVVCNPFEKLSQFVKQHHPLGHRASRWVGILASQMATSSQKSFETELSMLDSLVSGDGKKMCKRTRHINHGPEATKEVETTEDSTSSSESEDDESLKERCRHHRGRHGRDKHFGPFGSYDKHGMHGRRHFEYMNRGSKHFGPCGGYDRPFGGQGGPFGGQGGPFGGQGGPFGGCGGPFGGRGGPFGGRGGPFGGCGGSFGGHGGPFGGHGGPFGGCGGPFGGCGGPFGGCGGPFGGHGGPFGGHGGPSGGDEHLCEQYPFLSKKELKLMKRLYRARCGHEFAFA